MAIPASAFSRIPDFQNLPFGPSENREMLWSYYQFGGNESYLSLNTESEQFTVEQVEPITAIVSLCTGSACPDNESFVWLEYKDTDYTYSLGFHATSDAKVDSTSVPTSTQFSLLRPLFEIYANDYSAGIAVVETPYPYTSVEVTVSAVPLASSIVFLSIPLMLLAFVRR